MHYLEREFNRLVKYTQGLGVKVTKYNKKSDSSAIWMTDGSEIHIYNVGKKSYLQLIMDLLHELAHHRAFIESGRKGNLKTDKIFDKMAEDAKLTKKQRKIIYDTERSDYKWQEVIHNEVGLKIPVTRVRKEVKLDTWIYKYFYLHGTWPTLKERNEYKKTLK